MDKVIIHPIQQVEQPQYFQQLHLPVVVAEEVDQIFKMVKMEALVEEVMVVTLVIMDAEIHLLFLHLKVLEEEMLVNLDHHI